MKGVAEAEGGPHQLWPLNEYVSGKATINCCSPALQVRLEPCH